MHISNLIELAISFTLEVWLVALLLRRNAQHHFPVFFSFTFYAATATAARLLTSFHYRAYFYVFWWTEAFILLLSLAALHEIFHWMFEGFYRLWWFRLFYFGTIALVLSIAARNAIVDPPQAHPVISLILDAGIASNFVLAGIVSLFVLLHRLLAVEFRRYAYGIVLGFGFSSAGSLLGYLARSEFGTKSETFTRYSSAVGYILCVAIWVASFIRAEAEQKWEPPMAPEQMLEIVQGYLGALGMSKRRK
ncbi:MAG TPA: hypothetical protein VI636_04535 [Candidatus Angelobacter sp.]